MYFWRKWVDDSIEEIVIKVGQPTVTERHSEDVQMQAEELKNDNEHKYLHNYVIQSKVLLWYKQRLLNNFDKVNWIFKMFIPVYTILVRKKKPYE